MRPSLDILVRADVTYLRQDFSIMAEDPNRGGRVERFDFMVRTRTLTPAESAGAPASLEESPNGESLMFAISRLTK